MSMTYRHNDIFHVCAQTTNINACDSGGWNLMSCDVDFSAQSKERKDCRIKVNSIWDPSVCNPNILLIVMEKRDLTFTNRKEKCPWFKSIATVLLMNCRTLETATNDV